MRSFRYWGEVVFTDGTSVWLNDNGHEGWFPNDHGHISSNLHNKFICKLFAMIWRI